MQARQQAQQLARARTLEAACALLAAPGGELSLEAVAAAAGVTRVTVYNQFGSRPGLLLAVFAELGQRMRAERIQAAMREPEPRRALELVVRESARAWQRQRDAVKKVFALAVLDPELGREVKKAEKARRAGVVYLAQRLAAAGALGRGVSVAEASALLGALTSFQAFEALSAAGAGAALERRQLALVQSALELRAPGRRPVRKRRKP